MANQERTTIKGRVKGITFQNPENGYAVAKVLVEGNQGEVTLVGRMPGLAEGQKVEAIGRHVLHPRFGPQVEVEEIELAPPDDAEGVMRYLQSGLIKGVGPKLAQAMVDHLGKDAIDIILNQPERLAQVPGIGRKRAKLITQAVAAHGALREVMVFLQGHGVPASTALRIYRAYGAGAMGVLKNDPHRLAADIKGIGFATADKIAARLGMAMDHPSRLRAGLLYTLGQAADDGHVFLPRSELFSQAVAMLGVEQDLVEEALAQLDQAGEVVQESTDGEYAVYMRALNNIEQRAARALARLAGREGILPPERAAKAAAWVAEKLAVKPSPAQARALATLCASGLAVLTGGPGTGKTTLVRALITIAQRMGLSVALAAPTGRAAKRLNESTGLPALTLHRLLEYSPKENRWLRNAERPLEADLMVVDECSMVDIWLMALLAEAVPQKGRLVLVGDANQLPSVGPGLVLAQLIQSGQAAVASLTQIFRQDTAGLIVKNAHRILQGRMPLLPEPGQEADFYFVEEPDPEKAAEKIRRMVTERLPQAFGLDAVRDVQVLSPMHRGRLGCTNLNMLLREALNPQASGLLDVGDKVMQVRNNYDLETFNGDLGQVIARHDEGCRVVMSERAVEYSTMELDELTLAYAATVHKSQGSEYPAVVLALGSEHFIMLNRPLLYTAVTRGQKVVVIVGDPRALRRAVERDQPVRRHARLDLKLKQALEGSQPLSLG